MNFGKALEALHQGYRCARTGWNGKGMFVFLVAGSQFVVNRAPLLGIFDAGTEVTYRPHLDMRYADGTIGVWLASQSDMLADDWVVVGVPDDVVGFASLTPDQRQLWLQDPMRGKH